MKLVTQLSVSIQLEQREMWREVTRNGNYMYRVEYITWDGDLNGTVNLSGRGINAHTEELLSINRHSWSPVRELPEFLRNALQAHAALVAPVRAARVTQPDQHPS